MTFNECAEAFLIARRPGWRNPKHAAQWESTLSTYAAPSIGTLPVPAIDTGLVLRVLEPIWALKPETASRLRGRLEAILDWARVRGYREGDNPARWRGHLDMLLPAPSKIQKVKHHAALPYAELPAFMALLREQRGVAPRALEFTILTAARTSEAINATWGEFGIPEMMWTVAAERMKAGREHRVPLSPQALGVLEEVTLDRDGGQDFVFPGGKSGRPLSNMAMTAVLRRMDRGDLTVHGFRSSFRDWVAEQTNFSSEVVEMALAHTVGSKVEAAYRRGDLLAKRRQLMTAWGAFASKAPIDDGQNTT